MPRGLRNWTFSDVVEFLKAHGFRHAHTRGSHFYYTGSYDGKFKQTHVQYHGRKSINPRTINAIIRQSGIPKKEWLDW